MPAAPGESDVEADGHDQVDEVPGVGRFDQSRPQRADQLQDQLLGVDALEAVAQELRVEADLTARPGRAPDRLARLADVGRLGRDRQRRPARR